MDYLDLKDQLEIKEVMDHRDLQDRGDQTEDVVILELTGCQEVLGHLDHLVDEDPKEKMDAGVQWEKLEIQVHLVKQEDLFMVEL